MGDGAVHAGSRLTQGLPGVVVVPAKGRLGKVSQAKSAMTKRQIVRERERDKN